MKRLFQHGVRNSGRRMAVAIVLGGAIAVGAGNGAVLAANTAYFQKMGLGKCQADKCTVIFGRVAAKHRLLVQNISCFVSPETGKLEMTDAGLYASGGQYQAITPVRGKIGETEHYTLNQPVHFNVEGREKVKVRFASDPDHALYHAQCRIAGKVEKLN